LRPCRRSVSDINAKGPIGGAILVVGVGVWRMIEDVENEREDSGVVEGGVVVRDPSRVNIWTCILHLINSIGVLCISGC
jgi:hypothetical protein